MALISRHETQRESDGCIVTLYLNSQTSEFSQELDGKSPLENKSLLDQIQDYVKQQFPNEKVKLVKLMIGSVVVASLALGGAATVEASTLAATTPTAYTNYTVTAGDSLWIIASKLGVTITELKSINNLSSDTIYAGQVLKYPQKVTSVNYTTYKVSSGDSLYLIAKKYNTSIASIKSLNNMTTEMIYVGQQLKVPTATATPAPAPTPAPAASTYTVVSGDNLWTLSRKFNTTIDDLKKTNNLTSDMLYIGQVLTIPSGTTTPAEPVSPAPPVVTPITDPAAPSITYITHKVVSGDNLWNLSVKYGIPMTELLKVNGFTQSTVLSIGQEVRIPVHNVPVKPVLGPQYGERLDWWTEAQYVLPINKVFKVTDFATGRSFNIKRTIGANHADSEPMTAADSRIIKEVWGGAFSWTARAVIVEVDGRRIAASMASMPHDIEYIAGNEFDGHFDLHFYNSTRHKDGLVDPYHQRQINIAAGYVQK